MRTTTDFQCAEGGASFARDEVVEENIHFLLVLMMGKMSTKVADVSGWESSGMLLWLGKWRLLLR